MSAQNPTPAGGPLVEGPHDPEHDPRASYALEPEYVARADRPGRRDHRPRPCRSTSPLNGGPLANIPQSSEADVKEAFARARRAQAAWARTSLERALGDPAAAARPGAGPAGRDHRPDLLGVRQGPQARVRRAAAHRADRPLLRAHRARAPRHPAQARRRTRRSPGSRSTTCPRASSASSRRGTTRSRWRCATACPRCSPATPWSPSPTPRPCSRRCSAPELLEEAGFPKDLWQVVAGPGRELGTPIIERSDYICFTGSTATGRLIASAVRRAADRLLPGARRQEPDPGAARRRPREGRRGRRPRVASPTPASCASRWSGCSSPTRSTTGSWSGSSPAPRR